ncbi:hypothetical protein V8F20_006053 [Naviculisporaceae sp. PSN 640]
MSKMAVPFLTLSSLTVITFWSDIWTSLRSKQICPTLKHLISRWSVIRAKLPCPLSPSPKFVAVPPPEPPGGPVLISREEIRLQHLVVAVTVMGHG